jgi:peptidoglycan/LPS O-acetylase OafA/YrhL
MMMGNTKLSDHIGKKLGKLLCGLACVGLGFAGTIPASLAGEIDSAEANQIDPAFLGHEGQSSSLLASDDFQEAWLTGNKSHQYLGLASIALLGLAIVSPKEEGGPHEMFATASALLGGAAVSTGLIYHWDDFDFSKGLLEPDNLHVALAGFGALAMLYAVAQAPEVPHAGAGAIGGIAMGVAVKMTW